MSRRTKTQPRTLNDPKTIGALLAAPDTRGSRGGLYAAKLMFEFFVVTDEGPGTRRLCEDRIILIAAPTARAALREAKRKARASQHAYRNVDGNRVRFRFVGVLDLLHLGVECEAHEVWYTIRQRVQPMERRHSLCPEPHELSAIREEALLLPTNKRREREASSSEQ